jgi:hypothetical protein
LIGVLLFALSIRWSLSPLLLWVAIALLALAGGAAYMCTRAYGIAWNILARANRQVAPLETQRAALIPPPYPLTGPYPRLSYDVIVRDVV